LNYDAENRLVSVTGASTANFYYDADGKQVKTVVNGVTTYYVGNHYEVKNSVVTKYYFAGTTRLAVRTNGTLSFLLSDHIGSITVTTDANGAVITQALYKAFGEMRNTPGNLGTDYKFTGQREEASLGIYYFNARWFDPSLGRFTSPDSIVPTSTQGTQAWDRYGFVNNNPVRYNDPTGHMADEGDGGNYTYGDEAYTRQRLAAINCANGVDVEINCSYAELHPVETAVGFGVGLLLASADILIEVFIAAGEAAATACVIDVDKCEEEAESAVPDLNPKRLGHIFDNPGHQLDAFLQSFGGDMEKAFTAIYKAFSNVSGNYSVQELKDGITVNVNGFVMTVTGNIVNGVPRVSDAWIP
jgi:RHS repeat-associated protein